jgi:hypothetical protein
MEMRGRELLSVSPPNRHRAFISLGATSVFDHESGALPPLSELGRFVCGPEQYRQENTLRDELKIISPD